tara:strand:- start:454 stop:663 length:210 start_codon:yes stop_codon:yes gene_type:complete
MSMPQHKGDLIFPSQLVHFEICTSLPSSVINTSSIKAKSHFAQEAFTAIPHFEHSYVAIGELYFKKGNL